MGAVVVKKKKRKKRGSGKLDSSSSAEGDKRKEIEGERGGATHRVLALQPLPAPPS